MEKDKIIVITVSGRGDKDCAAIARYRGRISMSNIQKAFENGKAFIALYHLQGSRSGNNSRK